jgi:hypothetical protein
MFCATVAVSFGITRTLNRLQDGIGRLLNEGLSGSGVTCQIVSVMKTANGTGLNLLSCSGRA